MCNYLDLDGKELTLIIDGEVKYYLKRESYDIFGKYHRLGGPAIEYKNGSYIWCRDDLRHRFGGPALYDNFLNIICWYVNGREVDIYYIYG